MTSEDHVRESCVVPALVSPDCNCSMPTGQEGKVQVARLRTQPPSQAQDLKAEP